MPLYPPRRAPKILGQPASHPPWQSPGSAPETKKYVIPEGVVIRTLSNVQERGQKQIPKFLNSWNQDSEIGQKQYLILWPKMEYNYSAWKLHSAAKNHDF